MTSSDKHKSPEFRPGYTHRFQCVSDPRGFLNDSANSKNLSASCTWMMSETQCDLFLASKAPALTVLRAVVKEDGITDAAGSRGS